MRDTIAAVATPMAPGAIGILRLSGPEAVAAAAAVFAPESGRPLESYASRRLVYGTLHDREGRPIDKALATISRAPNSYTGEDTAELQCHGSPAVLALGLEALFAHGARQAKSGEFTRRAFLNGRLDLIQAEAVADLIDAESAAAARQAAGQLSGALGRRIARVYDGLTDLTAHFCAVLDYPDEDLDPFRLSTLEEGLSRAEDELSALLESYGRGRRLVQGARCAIVGRPNAGKSSLLNALVGYDRAIVTAVPGTTRDTVEERAELGGVPLRLIDTAGLRDTEDEAERQGVQRSRAALEEAELVLLVVDGSAPLSAEDRAVMEQVETCRRVICVLNKSDLPPAADAEELRVRFPRFCPVSALTGEGVSALGAAVAALFPHGAEEPGELLTNARQAEAAGRAREAVRSARAALAAGVTPDAVFSDVETALAALGELTGRSVSEDVTDRIFRRFCVGK